MYNFAGQRGRATIQTRYASIHLDSMLPQKIMCSAVSRCSESQNRNRYEADREVLGRGDPNRAFPNKAPV